MKRIFILLFAVGAVSSSYSQSFKFLEKEVTVAGSHTNFEIIAYGHVVNVNADSVFTWKRINKTFSSPIWTNAICDNVACFTVDTDRNSFIIPIGDSSILNSYVYPANTEGNAIVQLAVWAGNDSTNGDTITFSFQTWTSGVSMAGTNKSLNIYPNPSKSEITLDFESALPVKVEIYDMLGKKMATYDHNGTSSSLDVSHLSSGLYIVKVYENGASYTRTFNKIDN